MTSHLNLTLSLLLFLLLTATFLLTLNCFRPCFFGYRYLWLRLSIATDSFRHCVIFVTVTFLITLNSSFLLSCKTVLCCYCHLWLFFLSLFLLRHLRSFKATVNLYFITLLCCNSCCFHFQNYIKPSVMQRALPVAVKFLHKGNKELSRNMASYLSLAAIEHASLLSPHVQPIMDSIISGTIIRGYNGVR